MARFIDRESAGRELGHRLRDLDLEDPVVRAISPGGVVVGGAVARVLRADIDVADAWRLTGPTGGTTARVRLSSLFAPDGPGHACDLLVGRTAVLVSDGLLAEPLALSAVERAAEEGARRAVVAVPVGTAIVIDRMSRQVDDLVFLEVAGVTTVLAAWYEELPDVTDDDVARVVLPASAGGQHLPAGSGRPPGGPQIATAVRSGSSLKRSSRVPTLRATVRWPPR